MGCEGYLISNKHILITANCVVGATYFDIFLGGGESLQSSNTAWAHPGYDDSTFSDNIAILELSEPVEFTENIQTIALPDAGEVVHEGDLGTVCAVESMESMVCQDNIPVLTEEECEAFCLISSTDSCLGKSVLVDASG